MDILRSTTSSTSDLGRKKWRGSSLPGGADSLGSTDLSISIVSSSSFKEMRIKKVELLWVMCNVYTAQSCAIKNHTHNHFKFAAGTNMSRHCFWCICANLAPTFALTHIRSPIMYPLRITNRSAVASGLLASQPYPDLGLIERTTVTLHQYCLCLVLILRATWQTRCSYMLSTPQQGRELVQDNWSRKPW